MRRASSSSLVEQEDVPTAARDESVASFETFAPQRAGLDTGRTIDTAVFTRENHRGHQPMAYRLCRRSEGGLSFTGERSTQPCSQPCSQGNHRGRLHRRGCGLSSHPGDEGRGPGAHPAGAGLRKRLARQRNAWLRSKEEAFRVFAQRNEGRANAHSSNSSADVNTAVSTHLRGRCLLCHLVDERLRPPRHGPYSCSRDSPQGSQLQTMTDLLPRP